LKGIANMKAVVVHEFGKPLLIESVPVPELVSSFSCMTIVPPT
jgi:hypothetical protein